MKSSELRIGSWVETYDCEQNQLLIEDFALMYERNLDADEYCKPIPLTEEWLVKFGFEWYHPLDHWRLVVGNVWMYVQEMGGNWWFKWVNLGYDEAMISCPIEVPFVHTLQNRCYYVAGQELKTDQDGAS